MRMFNAKSFAVFQKEGLESRMRAIRSEIQPVFRELDEYFKMELEKQIEVDLFVHIAQHIRRSVHPPENTWSALSQQKRGYKMEPHFQLGIFPEYVFMWLSIIDQPKGKDQMAESLLQHPEWWMNLSNDFVLSKDHTIEGYEELTTDGMAIALTRLKKVKKSELQLGRVIPKTSPLWQDPEKARAYMLDTYHQLLPMYQGLMKIV